MNPIFFILAASIVELSAAINLNNSDSWATTFGILSLIVVMVLLVLQSKKPELCTKVLYTLPNERGDVTTEMLIAILLFIWWSIAAGILTFDNPFTTTSNGYFATWAGFASSHLLLSGTVPVVGAAAENAKAKLRQPGEAGPQSILCVCAIMVVIAGAQVNNNAWETSLVIIFGVCGVVYSSAMLLAGERFDAATHRLAALIMLVLWATEAGVGTFRAPFVNTGNGYFASWTGLVACIYIAMPHLPEHLRAKSAFYFVSERLSRASASSVTVDVSGGPAHMPPVPPMGPEPLPAGWVKKTDQESGNVYYYHEFTGETTWERP